MEMGHFATSVGVGEKYKKMPSRPFKTDLFLCYRKVNLCANMSQAFINWSLHFVLSLKAVSEIVRNLTLNGGSPSKLANSSMKFTFFVEEKNHKSALSLFHPLDDLPVPMSAKMSDAPKIDFSVGIPIVDNSKKS